MCITLNIFLIVDFHTSCIICIMAFKEPPSVTRQLLVARLGGMTSLNNSEVSLFTTF